ncbi:peptidyl-prolyl cis-trans isomerase FKBP17-1, chloroplastic [Argentina anserina]|uniref:peptidyl-prolyl cis-trans isomerase FKBP17-1, chloroplastic n=1 Tax=Argentina anserina TaxID=57926 RepID=UPI0021766F2D|nr:peptidyl-prolyl cis-trans isomerase FKBP17-1, chloroplastic [Potentilla anserina]
MMMLQYSAALRCSLAPDHPTTLPSVLPNTTTSSTSSPLTLTRRVVFSAALISTTLGFAVSSPSNSAAAEFLELPNSGGVKALDLRVGTGEVPSDGDQVSVHYYGRLAAKQGWRFDSTYDHKDENGEPSPFVFVVGSGKVISGIETAVKSMKVGSLRRIVIPPSQGYQSTSQEPIPPNFFDRQRLFTTIFNPTRLANGEGSTLGTLVFDIELVSLRHN